MEKEIVGLVEKVEIIGEKKLKTYALFDTGARMTSIDIRPASKAKVGPIIRTTRVKNPSFKERVIRPVVRLKINIKGRTFDTHVNLQDRSHMSFPVIIGRNIILGNFVVDAKKNFRVFEKLKGEKERLRLKDQSQLDVFINSKERNGD